MKRIIGIIPARGGSKGIPNKNITEICGKPLIVHTIEAALRSQLLDRVIVSTDCSNIAQVAHSAKCPVHIRPSHLAQDNTPTRPVLLDVLREAHYSGYQPDAVMTLQPTSPLRNEIHIDEAISLFTSCPEADSLVSCVELPHIFHPYSIMAKNEDGYLVPSGANTHIVRRQDKPTLYARNGAAIYITKSDKLPEYIFGGRILPYHMSPLDSIDVDTPTDLYLAELLLSQLQPAK